MRGTRTTKPDRREMPAYSVAEAAHSLSIPISTVRYWAAVACSASDAIPDALQTQLQRAMKDDSIAVRIEAANALARHAKNKEGIKTLIDLFGNEDETVVLHAARAIELLGDPSTKPAVQKLAERYKDEPSDMAWFIRFTTSGYLSRQ